MRIKLVIFKRNGKDLMSSSLIEMVNKEKNIMPPRAEMEINDETS